jgi:hypothetical protein
MLARAKAEKDWHAIPALKATADLIRWTMANADTLKAAAAVVKHPAVRGCLRPFLMPRSRLLRAAIGRASAAPLIRVMVG